MNNLKIKKNYFILLFLLILIIVTFFPLLKVGFTTADDAMSYLTLINPKANLIIVAKSIAESQSRFQYFFVFLISLFPFLFVKKIIIFKIISLGQIILNFILFSFLAYKISKSKVFSLIVFLFLVTFLQNSWQHNLLTAYPFIFSFGFNLSLSSLILLVNYLETKVNWKLIVSVILFFFSLFNYEVFVLYLIIFFLIAIFTLKGNNLADKIKTVFKTLLYHKITLLLFLTVYIIFRVIFPGLYEGTHSFNFNIFRIIRTSFQFAIASFPTYIYRHSIGEILKFSYTYDRALLNFGYILKNIQLDWLIKGLISFFLCFIFLMGYKKIKNKTLLFLMFISVFFIFIPGLLQSFVNKYQSWVIDSNQIAFTPTFFSFFGMTLLIASTMFLILNIFKNKTVLIIFYILISLSVFRMSVTTDYSNYFYTLDQSQLFNVWKSMDKFISTDDFLRIPNNSIIYAPTLCKYTSQVILKDTTESYWSDYINSKTGKNIKIINSEEKLDNIFINNIPFYFLGFSLELKDLNQFIGFAKPNKIDSNSVRKRILSDSFVLFTLSKYKNYQIIYGADDNTHYFLVNRDLETNPLVRTQVKDSNIDLYTVNIIHYLDSLPPLGTFNYQFGEGFYNEEIDNDNIFRWSNNISSITMFNQGDDKYINVSFEVTTGVAGNAKLQLGGDLLQDNISINSNPTLFNRTIYLTKGKHIIDFHTNAKKLEALGDYRDLYFRIINFKINEK